MTRQSKMEAAGREAALGTRNPLAARTQARAEKTPPPPFFGVYKAAPTTAFGPEEHVLWNVSWCLSTVRLSEKDAFLCF